MLERFDGTPNPFFRQHTIRCRHTARAFAALKGENRVTVEAFGARGETRCAPTALERSPGHGRRHRRRPAQQFPVRLSIQGQWASATARPTVPRRRVDRGRTTAQAPVRVAVPFDFWPVTFLNQLPAAVISTESFEVDAAPFVTDERADGAKTTFLARHETELLRGPRADVDFIAPARGALKLRIQGPPTPVSAVIDEPGVYVIDAQGLRKATPADEPDAGSPPVPPPRPRDGGVDAAPPPPAATCGNAGRIYCLDDSGQRVCNPGTRLEVSTCPCGKPGQTYCYDGSGQRVCDRGARLEVNSCVACGRNGQTYCLDGSGQRVCNAGHRLDVNVCVTCGNEGQTYCLDGSGQRVCSGSLRLEGLTCVR